MKLKVKQLKAFNSVASSMKQNKILPVLSYLKFENGKITKSNLESFIEMEADFEGSALINEKILMSFIDSISAEEIDVKVNGTKVILSHEKEKDNSSTEDVKNFPIHPVSDGNEIEIPTEVLKSINIASNFTMNDDVRTFVQCVFLGNGLIAASTGFIAYTEKIDDSIPEIILEKEEVSVIKNFTSVSFSQNDSYHFFTNNIFRFGFIKKDTKYINLKQFNIVPDGDKIVMDKGSLLKFCDMVSSRCAGRIIIAKITGDKVSMIDEDYGNDAEKPLQKELPDFSFNPVFMSKLLKSVPDDELTFLKDGNKYFITGESGFVSLIVELK